MSKERARRREEREREAAIKAAARAAEAERRERRTARAKAVRAHTTDRFRVGRQTGELADADRRRTTWLLLGFAFLNLVVWLVRPDWPARVGALLVSLLVFPVARHLMVDRR